MQTSCGSSAKTRRSVRRYGERAIRLKQLGEFLHRVARVRRTYPPSPETGRFYEVSQRPYPSGGACYDLEFYVAVNRCEGLEPGLYHYDPLDHELCRLA